MSTETIVNPRTGMGAAIGGLIGFICAGPPGAAIGAIVGGGVAHASNQPDKGVLTDRRKLIYERAMEKVNSPADLTKLADAFSGEGLDAEADMLRKRAALRSLPADVKEQRRVFFKKAMASDNPDMIEQVATAFQGEGAFDAAKTLRDHGEAVTAAHMAGKSTKPLAGASQEKFADKLAKAIVHFGPNSLESQNAAKNLIMSRGKQPSDGLVNEVIKIAAKALDIQAPPRAAPPVAPVEIDGREPGVVEADANGIPEAADDVPPPEAAIDVSGEKADRGAPEPTVVGPPAAKVEPPAGVEIARAEVGGIANEGNGMANEGGDVTEARAE